MAFFERLALARDLRKGGMRRVRALHAVAKLGPAGQPFVGQLLSILEGASEQDSHRMLALQALHRLGPHAGDAAPWLASRMRDQPSVTWRVYYAWAHWRVTGKGDDAMAIWREAVTREDGVWALVAATNMLGAQAAPAWPLFEARLQKQASVALQTSLVHIADTLLGRGRATEAVERRIGHERAAEIFAELDAQRAAD